jgi:HK97 family phage major capsid protein
VAKEVKAGEYTQDEIEKLFDEIAEKKIAAAREDWEKAAIKTEESRKTALRSEWMDLMAKGQQDLQAGKSVEDLSPMTLFGQFAMTGAKLAAERGTAAVMDKKEIFEMAKKAFPGAKTFHGIVEKDLQANVPSAGGFGIPSILSPDIIRVLYAQTILDKIGAVKVPMPNGNFKMARMDTASSVGWVNELPAEGKTEPVFGDISLTAKKLFAMVPISNSLLRYNAVGMDSWVAQDLQQKARIALDAAALYGPGTVYQPKGLANQGIQTSGSTSTAFGLTTPIDMTALLEQANVPMLNPYWVLNPIGKSFILGKAFSTGPFAWAAEMLQNKTLNGSPFVTSATVAKASDSTYADFWLGDFSEFVWGVGYDLSLEITREGSYVSGGTTYSAWQRDETIVRLISEHDFDVKHPVSFVQGTYSKT